LIDNQDPVLQNLAARQRDIQTLLVATASGSHATADLIRRNRAVLDQTLASLHTDLGVIDQHQVDLAATISYLRVAVQGYQSVGYSQGIPNHWANIFVQSLGPAGVDAILGRCGALDQLIDQLLATNCRNGGGGVGGVGGKGGGLPSLPPLPTPSLPPLPTPSISPVPRPSISIPPLPTPSFGAPYSYDLSSGGMDPSGWASGVAAGSLQPAAGAALPQSIADLLEFALLASKAGLP